MNDSNNQNLFAGVSVNYTVTINDTFPELSIVYFRNFPANLRMNPSFLDGLYNSGNYRRCVIRRISLDEASVMLKIFECLGRPLYGLSHSLSRRLASS